MKKLLKIENLACLIIILLPIYLLRFNLFDLPTNALEILMVAFIIGALYNFRKNDWRTIYFRYKYQVILFLIIISGLVVSLLVNANRWKSLGIIKSWFILPFIFSLLAIHVFKKENRGKVFFSIYFSAFLTSLIALGYLISGHLTFDGRLEAFFNSPNYLAMHLAPAIIIIVFDRDSRIIPGIRKTISKQRFVIFELVVILIAFYFTYSYAAWAAVLAALFFIYFLDHKINRQHIATAILIIATIIFLLKDTPKFQDLIHINERSSLSSRLMIWQSAEKMLETRWFLGIGPGNFQEKYLDNQKYFPPYLEWAVPHPHDLFLAFWLYGGLVSLFSFLTLLAFTINRALWQKNNRIILMAFGILIYILLHGLVDTTYFKNDLAVIFWIVALAI